MTRRQFERELSRATGESVDTIRNLGFQLVEPPDLAPLTVDWDSLEAERIAIFPARECRAGRRKSEPVRVGYFVLLESLPRGRCRPLGIPWL